MKVNISEEEIDFDGQLKQGDDDAGDEDLHDDEVEPVEIDLGDEDPETPEEPAEDEPDEDPETPEEPAEDEEDEQEDLSSFSKKTQARIKREIKVKLREREGRLRAEKELAELKQRLVELETERDASTIDDRIEAAKTKLKDARYESDVDAEMEAIAELSRLNERKAEVERRKQAKVEIDNAQGAPNEALDAWMERNKSWFGKPGYEIETEAALVANKKILQSGIPDDDPRFYVRLDKELRSRVKLPEQKRARSEVASVMDDAPVRGSKVTLGPSDFKFMRSLGLDPMNKAHLREYAAQKKQEARQ